MHTFVTPVVGRCEIVGDYRYNVFVGEHGVPLFGNVETERVNVRLSRSVVLSAAIQTDFDNSDIMLKVCKLEGIDVISVDLRRRESRF